MKKILIADPNKASLVMTSEVFKDNYPGIQVIVARSASEVYEAAVANKDIDAFIIDFDLPDFDGAQTAAKLKKLRSTPILITAFDSMIVEDSINKYLSKYPDCRSWLKKPVNNDIVVAVVQRFCEGKIRSHHRISCALPAFAKIEIQVFEKMCDKEKLSSKDKLAKTKKPANPGKISASKKVTEKKLKAKTVELELPLMVEDMSLTGAKVSLQKTLKKTSLAWKSLITQVELIKEGSAITLFLPCLSDIRSGQLPEIESHMKDAQAIHSLSGKKLSQNTDKKIQILEGKVIWTNSENGMWRVGIEFSDHILSKNNFEILLSKQSKQRQTLASPLLRMGSSLAR
ncbi:MAG: response regulator [Silvanigrellaceae bacterium]|nr:response regulator [Silvanigrellaceae bacterium]